jgi:hypothetical protein
MTLHTTNRTNSSAPPAQADLPPSTVGAGWHTVRRTWKRLSGARGAQEERRSVTDHSAAASVTTSTSGSRGDGNARVPKSTSGTGSPASARDPVGRNVRQERNTRTTPVCEVCGTRACVITRKAAAGAQCLCRLELHVPLGSPENGVSRVHECASCTKGRYVEMERQRKRRVESGLFASFSVVPVQL